MTSFHHTQHGNFFLKTLSSTSLDLILCLKVTQHFESKKYLQQKKGGKLQHYLKSPGLLTGAFICACLACSGTVSFFAFIETHFLATLTIFELKKNNSHEYRSSMNNTAARLKWQLLRFEKGAELSKIATIYPMCFTLTGSMSNDQGQGHMTIFKHKWPMSHLKVT